MSILSRKARNDEADIDVAARTQWTGTDDAGLEALRKDITAKKSAYRQEHNWIRARALARIDRFEAEAKTATDVALRRRLANLGAPEDIGTSFDIGELSRALLAFTPLAKRWRELLAADRSVTWSDLSVAEFEQGLREFDAEDEAIRRELALRAARRDRIAAERREAEVAAR